MIHLLLQTSPDLVNKILEQPGDNITSKVIFAVLVAMLLAIGSFVAYVFYKYLDSNSKQTEALVANSKAVPEAINGLKEAMITNHNGVKEIMLLQHAGLKESIEVAKDQIIDEVRDQKLKLLSDRLKK